MFVQTDKENNWLVMTFDRPQRGNAFGTMIADELTAILGTLSEHLEAWSRAPQSMLIPVRGIVFRAKIQPKGRPIWIAGGDLKELSGLTSLEDGRAYAEKMGRLCEMIETMPIPVIMAVNGRAIGGGVEFCLAGDIRYATVDSTFEFRQLDMGLPTGYRGGSRLVELVGRSRAQGLLYQRMRLQPEQAEAHGIIHRTFGSESSMNAGIARLRESFDSVDPRVLSTQKKILRLASLELQPSRGRSETDLFADVWMNPTQRERLSAFLAQSDRG